MGEIRQRGRIRWGRWIGLSALALVLALVVGHAIWGSVAEGRLQRRIQALRDAGEPILPEDFVVADVESPENGGIDVIEAASLLPPLDDDDPRYLFATPVLPLNDKERSLLASVVPGQTEGLARLDAAFRKPRMDWEPDLQSPILGNVMSGREEFKALTTALLRQAIYDFDRGQHQGSLLRLDQMVALSRYPDTHPSLIGHLVAIGCLSRATDWLMEMSPELKIGDAAQAIPAEDAQRTIQRLLEDGPWERGLMHALRGERMANVDTMRSILGGLTFPVGSDPGRPWPAPLRYLARPVLLNNASTMIDHMTGLIAAAGSKTLPDAKARLPRRLSPSLLNHLPYMLINSNDRILESHYRSVADRRLAAIALAVRWYAVEHEGLLPATLGELVPRYLPHIPADPMAPNEELLSYVPREGNAILWSVGSDGIDEEGNEAPIKPSHRFGVGWEMKDRVIPLYRRPRPEPPPDFDLFGEPPATNETRDLFDR